MGRTKEGEILSSESEERKSFPGSKKPNYIALERDREED